MSNPLWKWSATALAEAVAAGRVSSRAVAESALARLDAVNPQVNAVADVLRNEALRDADAADAAVRRGGPLGELHGVPVTVKIDTDYAGRATTSGVVAYRDRIAPEDAPAVRNLRAAGAVIIGLTNVPAFTTRYFTDNDLHGRTYNPWNPGLTPGGSSGGAAVAVATGIGAIAHGGDRAGSIRYPAYASGVLGLRPSVGRVSRFNATAPEFPGIFSQLTQQQGVMTRTANDARLGFRALARHDPLDPWVTQAPLDTGVGPTRVAVFEGDESYDVDPEVGRAVANAAEQLAEAGYTVTRVRLPYFREAAELFWYLSNTEEALSRTRAIAQHGDEGVKRARASTLAYAPRLDLDAYIRAFSRRAEILRAWNAVLVQHPLLVLPVSWRKPFPVDQDQQGDAAMAALLDAQHPLLAVSLLGLPSLAVPIAGVSATPLGVQLVGARFQEETLFRAAEGIEQRQGILTPVEPAGQRA